jgi:hypothetical protein
MPYKREGRTVFVKRGKRWVKKAEAKSVENAEKMMRLLRGIKHGLKPRKSKKCGGPAITIVLGTLKRRKEKNGKT